MSSSVALPANTSFTRGAVADIFSSYVASAALSAAYEFGLLDRLEIAGEVSLSTFDPSIDSRVLYTTCNALAWAQIIRRQGNHIWPGPLWDEAYAARGYFYWLVRGCGETFTVAPDVAKLRNRNGNFYNRNMRAVAIGSRLIGDGEVENLFDKILANASFTRVADLGCGSGQRLIRIARNNPGVTGIGVDISNSAVKLAKESIEDAGLSRRISVVRDNVLKLTPQPAFDDVDVVTCVFMGHDFWPMESCVNTLRGLREAFPNAHTLLLCDVVRSTMPPGSEAPIFQHGFESIHALMGVYLPTLAEWQQAFTASGWQCDAVRPTDSPPGGFLFELSRVESNLNPDELLPELEAVG